MKTPFFLLEGEWTGRLAWRDGEASGHEGHADSL
jgi:hypothetical protein